MCVAVCCKVSCCSVLQCVAVCCSACMYTREHAFSQPSWICVLHCVAVCCSVLQCAAVCCSVMQFVAVYCIVLQCAAVCCNVLQCGAVCVCIAVSCSSMLQCIAVCCSALQFFAMNRHATLLYNCFWKILHFYAWISRNRGTPKNEKFSTSVIVVHPTLCLVAILKVESKKLQLGLQLGCEKTNNSL